MQKGKHKKWVKIILGLVCFVLVFILYFKFLNGNSVPSVLVGSAAGVGGAILFFVGIGLIVNGIFEDSEREVSKNE